jgi:hypothetical protein
MVTVGYAAFSNSHLFNLSLESKVKTVTIQAWKFLAVSRG